MGKQTQNPIMEKKDNYRKKEYLVFVQPIYR